MVLFLIFGGTNPRAADLVWTAQKSGVLARLAAVLFVDRDHGWALPAWQAMGSPAWPTPAQLDQLHQAAQPAIERARVDCSDGKLHLRENLSALGMRLIEIEAP